jgi:hypothetical protein
VRAITTESLQMGAQNLISRCTTNILSMPVCLPFKRLNLKIVSHKLGTGMMQLGMMQLQPTRTMYLLTPYNHYNKSDARNFDVEVEFMSNDRRKPNVLGKPSVQKGSLSLAVTYTSSFARMRELSVTVSCSSACVVVLVCDRHLFSISCQKESLTLLRKV